MSKSGFFPCCMRMRFWDCLRDYVWCLHVRKRSVGLFYLDERQSMSAFDTYSSVVWSVSSESTCVSVNTAICAYSNVRQSMSAFDTYPSVSWSVSAEDMPVCFFYFLSQVGSNFQLCFFYFGRTFCCIIDLGRTHVMYRLAERVLSLK